MFKQLSSLLVLVAIVYGAPTGDQTKIELMAAGMSQATIDGLSGLEQKFKEQYPAVAANEGASKKFLEEFRVESDNFMSQMPPADKKIYDDYVQKQGDKAFSELKSAGMSQQSIDALNSLTSKFTSEYAKVSGDKAAADKFLEEFKVESANVVNAMPPSDKAIYEEYIKKQGLAKRK